ILVNKEQLRQLKSLQEKFIRLAQTLKYYGYLKFDPCVTDFPEKGCHVVVSAGNNELNFQVRLPNEQIKEGSFKVTRMRCWRVTSSVSTTGEQVRGEAGVGFWYLMSKDRLQWVTITSPQVELPHLLQSMVDELMVEKSGGSIRKMFRRRMNGALRRSDSQQAVKSPPLLVRGNLQPWVGNREHMGPCSPGWRNREHMGPCSPGWGTGNTWDPGIG
uniref:Sorting nexin-17/31 FERM domain-containing protein n=1 Tax=Malurus cyaneus samueli TaxID=2593467 RepID=A0A8C5UDV5_9PASS